MNHKRLLLLLERYWDKNYGKSLDNILDDVLDWLIVNGNDSDWEVTDKNVIEYLEYVLRVE